MDTSGYWKVVKEMSESLLGASESEPRSLVYFSSPAGQSCFSGKLTGDRFRANILMREKTI